MKKVKRTLAAALAAAMLLALTACSKGMSPPRWIPAWPN